MPSRCYRQPFSRFILAALNKIGLSSIAGFNSGELIGHATFSYTINPTDETRSSSETSFLQAAIEAGSGIQVYTQTSAKRIIIGSDNKTATGVLVSTNDYPYTLSAKKEVIVAAGAVRYLSLSESSLNLSWCSSNLRNC